MDYVFLKDNLKINTHVFLPTGPNSFPSRGAGPFCGCNPTGDGTDLQLECSKYNP